ncbi:MAG: tetratricopeptide repeat protein [Flavobacteriales bacterium]|nr:tetratricopeptide repeat protein [Flavobacteriales bacterium]
MIRRLFPVLILIWGPALATAQYMADATPRSGMEELYKAGEKAYRSGEYSAAIALFGQVLENEPDHVNALLQRGFCHSLNAEYDLAVKDFSAVIERKNDHTWAYTSRGSAYNKLGQYELAIADFNKVLAIDPKNEEAYNNRGWARKATGDISAACKDWNTSKRMGNAEAKIILTNNRCK